MTMSELCSMLHAHQQITYPDLDRGFSVEVTLVSFTRLHALGCSVVIPIYASV